jgi:hypothetical protein
MTHIYTMTHIQTCLEGDRKGAVTGYSLIHQATLVEVHGLDFCFVRCRHPIGRPTAELHLSIRTD